MTDRMEPMYFTNQDGVKVVDTDWTEKKTDITAYMMRYNLPGDMRELLYLEVVGANWRLEGRQIVLAEKPTQYVRDAIIIHYRKNNDPS